MNKCIICSNELKGKQTLYCCSKCKNSAHQSYQSQQLRGMERKKKMIMKLGGECFICGYKKNQSALVFHHQTPKEKSFKLDLRSLSNRKESAIYDELKKCMLLCSNCHAEIHNPQHNLEP